MGLIYPGKPWRIEDVDVVRVEREMKTEPVIKYVDREVVKEIEKVIFKDDPKLLEQLNRALKENGELRIALQKMPKMAEPKAVSEPKIVETFVEIEKKIRNIKQEIIIAAASFSAGGFLCWLILR